MSRPSRFDVGLALAVMALALTEVLVAPIEPYYASLPAAIIAPAALAFRRSAPLAVVLIVAGAETAQILLGVDKGEPASPLLTMVIAAYTLGERGSTRDVVLGGGISVALVYGSIVSQPPVDPTDFPFVALVLLGPLVLGRALGATRREARGAAERAVAE